MTEQARYALTVVARDTGISLSTLYLLRREGLLPAPEKRGRTRVYSAEIVAQIPAALAARRESGRQKRAQGTKLSWANPEEHTRRARSIKNSWGDPGLREAQARRMEETWAKPHARKRRIRSLRKALARPEERQRRSAAMKSRMAEQKALLKAARVKLQPLRETPDAGLDERIAHLERDLGLAKKRGGRPATKAAIFAQALKVHEKGRLSWSNIAEKLVPDEYKQDGPDVAGQRLRKGVLTWKRRAANRQN